MKDMIHMKKELVVLERRLHERRRDMAEMGFTRTVEIAGRRYSGKRLVTHLSQQAEILRKRIANLTPTVKKKKRVSRPSRGQRRRVVKE